MIKNVFVSFLLTLAVLGTAQENDEMWLEFLDSQEPLVQEVVVQEIKFNLSQELKEKIFHDLLFFQVGDKFTPAQWKEIADFQEKFLRAGNPFYSLEIYNIPLTKGGDRIVIDAVGGFPFGFSFWPWDITVIHRNVFGSGERSQGTLGLTEQSVSYEDWNLGSFPFGGAFGVKHQWIEDLGGYLREDIQLQGGLLKRWGPYLETRASASGNLWKFPSEGAITVNEPQRREEFLLLDGLSGEDLYGIKTELEAGLPQAWALLPKYAGGLKVRTYKSWFSTGDENWGWGVSERILWSPWSWLMLTQSGIGGLILGAVPAPARLSSQGFRYPGKLFQGNALGVSRVQALLQLIPEVPLGFTSLVIRPLVFTDQMMRLESTGNYPQFKWSYGGGVDFYFSDPIGLSFVFGYKGSRDEQKIHGFLFELKTEIY